MRLGRTERRLAFAIVLTAVIPLIVSIYFARSLVDRAFAQAFAPELGDSLDQALGVYQDLARSIKDGMRYQADAIAADPPLRAAAASRQRAAVERELGAVFSRYPDLVSLDISLADGTRLASKDRGRSVDATAEVTKELRRSLGDEAAPVMALVFATPRARFDQLGKMGEVVRAYHHVEGAARRSDLYAFAAILLGTIVVAVALGTLLARGVTRRIGALAVATQAVARGDLAVRVPEIGNDELTDLSRGFNRMLGEVEVNRARVEFLQRMSTWQEMARRLAHEIKNPLTPILLAVEECHRKYADADPEFRKLLDATLEIVEEEVGTLRRLVGEFSSFARLPRADLAESDLAEFLREQSSRAVLALDDLDGTPGRAPGAPAAAPDVQVRWNIPDGVVMPAHIDRQMLHLVLANVLRNAAQAVAVTKRPGRVEVSVVPEAGAFALSIDDDGPGVPEGMRDSVFDPYFTTRAEGTGLGLSIVKKIVVEHGGTIDVSTSPLGGARFRIRIPRLRSPAGTAAHEATALARSGVRSI